MAHLSAKHVLKVLRELLEEGWPVRYAVLFGSLAKGWMHPLSDIDVGVRAPEERRVELASNLALELASRLGVPEDRVDVVLFDYSDISAKPAFFYEMLAEGILAWGDEDAYIEDLVRAALLCADHGIQLRKLGYIDNYVKTLGEVVEGWGL